MPCFSCVGCGRCIRSKALRRRCVKCFSDMEVGQSVCPSCGEKQPPLPGQTAPRPLDESMNKVEMIEKDTR